MLLCLALKKASNKHRNYTGMLDAILSHHTSHMCVLFLTSKLSWLPIDKSGWKPAFTVECHSESVIMLQLLVLVSFSMVIVDAFSES